MMIIILVISIIQRVGCDLRIGSTKKIDSCGVCGGDGTTCSEPLYHWHIAPMSACSLTCGGGELHLKLPFYVSLAAAGVVIAVDALNLDAYVAVDGSSKKSQFIIKSEFTSCFLSLSSLPSS